MSAGVGATCAGSVFVDSTNGDFGIDGFSTTCCAWSGIDDGHTVIAGFPDAIVSVDDAFII